MFSRRVPASLEPNALALAVGRARAAGRPVIDLTVSNPTRVGLPYPGDLLDALADAAALAYEPDPLGLPAAREAVVRDYARRGVDVAPERVLLTASTSEAYSHVFKLLCDEGDEVLVPQPSYPLFEHLARLDLVHVRPYPLDPHGGWSFDVEAVAAAITPRAKAIVVVSPNNPTGTCLDEDAFAALDALAATRGLAVVCDEVFADYPLTATSDSVVSVLSRPREALTVALGGLSKSVGLPQLKLGWMALGGSDEDVGGALARLEVIADTYLSVATPVAVAASKLLGKGGAVREAIGARVRRNFAAAGAVAAAHPSCERQPAGGGWSVVLRVPALHSEERLCLALLEEREVLVHPGYFFDFPSEAYLVASLLASPEAFDEGVRRVCELVEGR